MVLIIGGAYQGKTRYALQHYQNRKIYYVQNLLKEAKQKNIDERNYIEQLVENEPEAVFTLDDVGCGIDDGFGSCGKRDFGVKKRGRK